MYRVTYQISRELTNNAQPIEVVENLQLNTEGRIFSYQVETEQLIKYVYELSFRQISSKAIINELYRKALAVESSVLSSKLELVSNKSRPNCF